MAAAALPAPTTRVLPGGGLGRCGGRIFSASAASTAARKLSISSTKSHLGHLLGASGGVEAVITAKTIYHNLIPPTINLENPDPECDLDYTPGKARDKKVSYAMSNSFGFGGHNASLLLKKIS